MSGRTRFLLGFAMAAMAAQGCTSTSGPSPASPDSGDDGTGGSGMDGGVPMTCDASLPVSSDAAAGQACTACKVQMCSTELAKCAADCTCGPIEACLEGTTNTLFTACTGAIDAVMGGNPSLPALIQCLDAHCFAPCFKEGLDDSGAGADSGATADAGAGADSGVTADSGVQDARGQ